MLDFCAASFFFQFRVGIVLDSGLQYHETAAGHNRRRSAEHSVIGDEDEGLKSVRHLGHSLKFGIISRMMD